MKKLPIHLVNLSVQTTGVPHVNRPENLGGQSKQKKLLYTKTQFTFVDEIW